MKYSKPIIKVSGFEKYDIITTSGESENYINAKQYAEDLKQSGQVAGTIDLFF